MKIRKSIKFGLMKLKGVEDDLRIRMRVHFNGNRISIPLTCRISLEKWDQETESALPKYEDKFGNSSKDINREIDKYRSAMEKAFAKFELVDERMPTKEELMVEFGVLAGRKAKFKAKGHELTVQQAGIQYIVENYNVWSENTHKKMKTSLSHLKSFDKDMTFENIDDKLLGQYVDYLLKQGHRNTTVQKEIRLFKNILNWCTRKKLNNKLDYKEFQLRLKTLDSKIIFLTWDELMTLYNIELKEDSHLDRVRDVFCFCCFTSLRYSDVQNLKKSDITDSLIEVVTVKTSDRLRIDLNDYSRKILDKYKGVHFEKEKALPVISNQKMNDYIKELGKVAEIDTPVTMTYYKGNKRHEDTFPKYELLSTHCGRRTFICNALALGIPPHVVMKWTGHADYEAMKPYIAVADETKIEAMKRFNK